MDKASTTPIDRIFKNGEALDETLHTLPITFKSSSTANRAYLPILWNDYVSTPPMDRYSLIKSQEELEFKLKLQWDQMWYLDYP